MSNLVRCSNCEQIIIAEDFDDHKCKIPIKCCSKEIPVEYFVDCSTDTEKAMIGKGLDGVSYWFVVKPRKALPWYPSNDFTQGRKPNDKYTVPK